MHDRFSRIARRVRLAVGWAVVMLIATMAVAGRAVAAQDGKPSAAGTSRSLTLTETERRNAIERVLGHPAVKAGAPGHRLAGIRVTAAMTPGVSGETRTILTVVLFDHTALLARRVAIDAVTDDVIANEILTGHPQRSTEELEEATAIISRDAELARLRGRGAVLDGGFIVGDPGGSRRRMIQLKLMSGDRHTALRTITVDLTRRRISSVTRR